MGRTASNRSQPEGLARQLADLDRLDGKGLKERPPPALTGFIVWLTNTKFPTLSAVVPALVVCGDADKPVPLENASTILAGKIPDAQLVVVKDAGHFPHMEKPEIVNEAMWHWLRDRVAV